MPPAHRKGDIGSGHGCYYPPTPATFGSGNFIVNGKPAMRVGDSYAPDGCQARSLFWTVSHSPQACCAFSSSEILYSCHPLRVVMRLSCQQ
ncbi:hypothetical protein GGR30_004608 [Martelella radicis]|uniref:Uncharacterized protein n=1 Tax=Martelella radicis TaxID=1397476 RepID=A0A7W6KNQ4_9HYPH|nr:hypothetical protein [Martelella radicis]